MAAKEPVILYSFWKIFRPPWFWFLSQIDPYGRHGYFLSFSLEKIGRFKTGGVNLFKILVFQKVLERTKENSEFWIVFKEFLIVFKVFDLSKNFLWLKKLFLSYSLLADKTLPMYKSLNLFILFILGIEMEPQLVQSRFMPIT